jgi:hypothetical protein
MSDMAFLDLAKLPDLANLIKNMAELAIGSPVSTWLNVNKHCDPRMKVSTTIE